MKKLYSEEEIRTRIGHMADELANIYPDELIVAPILTGALFFAADLLRAMSSRGLDPLIDCVQLASYGGARSSSGVVKLLKDFSLDIAGRDVLLIDDVLDTGRSLHFARAMALEKGARSAAICVLVRKATGRSEDIDADFIGFETGADDFLVGYGMDDDGRKRGLPYIAAL